MKIRLDLTFQIDQSIFALWLHHYFLETNTTSTNGDRGKSFDTIELMYRQQKRKKD